VRVVFMGTPAFAVPSIEAVAVSHEIVTVYSRADSVSGRGSTTRPSPVKQAAVELGLRVRTPATLRDPAEHEVFRRLAPDIGIVAAYGLILPREVLDVPALGFLNVHASLLPRWRGAAPIQRAILAGDEFTGVSIMQMEEALDTGPYCGISQTTVADKNAEELAAELAVLGAGALIRALEQIAQDTCTWVQQDDAEVTYAAKLSKEDVRLAPELPAEELLRRIRASSRQTPARIALATTNLTVLDAREGAADVPPGIVRHDRKNVLLGANGGAIELLRVKPEGRREMDASAWIRGTTVPEGASWGSAQ